MDDAPVPPKSTDPAEIARRRRRTQSEKMARGNLSIVAQIGIVLGGFGLAFAVLYFSLWFASQPPARLPVDQNIIDYSPPAH